MKRNALVLLVAIMMIAGLGISTANAASSCSAATVVEARVNPALEGATSSKYQITIECAAWGITRPYVLTPEVGDAGYATALTALTTGQSVFIRVASRVGGSLMDIIALNAN